MSKFWLCKPWRCLIRWSHFDGEPSSVQLEGGLMLTKGLAMRPRLYSPCVWVCYKCLQSSGRYFSSSSPSSFKKSWSWTICWLKLKWKFLRWQIKARLKRQGRAISGVQWMGHLYTTQPYLIKLLGSYSAFNRGEKLSAPGGINPHHYPFHGQWKESRTLAFSFYTFPSFCETSLALKRCIYFSSEYLPFWEKKVLKIKKWNERVSKGLQYFSRPWLH